MHTKTTFRDPLLNRVAAFLGSMGIAMRPVSLMWKLFFPGWFISHGSLVIDESMLIATGDAQHEAAHIALSPAERRSDDFAFIEGELGGEELTAISWCWAALLQLDMQPEDVFHDTASKRRDSAMIIDHARRGAGFILVFRYCRHGRWPLTRNARLRGVRPFPHMVKWARGVIWQSVLNDPRLAVRDNLIQGSIHRRCITRH